MLLESAVLNCNCCMYTSELKIFNLKLEILHLSKEIQILERVFVLLDNSIVVQEERKDIIAPMRYAGIKLTLVDFIPNLANFMAYIRKLSPEIEKFRLFNYGVLIFEDAGKLYPVCG